MQKKVFRTVGYRIKDEQLTLAARSVCLASRNLRNCGVFIVRNVLSAHAETGFKADAALTDNERKALGLANEAVDACNATRSKKSTDVTRLFSHFGSGAPWTQILHGSVLDKVLRLFKDDSGASPYPKCRKASAFRPGM